MVINCTPHRCWPAGSGSAVSFSSAASSAGPEQVLLAARQLVEAAPQQVKIGARAGINAVCASQPQPDLLQPCSQRCVGQRSAQSARGIRHFEHALRSSGPLAEKRQPLCEQLRYRPRQQLRIVVARKLVQIVERKAAPRGAQNAQPSDAVLRVQQRAGQRERIQHFGPVAQPLEIEGAEGNRSLAQSLGNGRERLARPAKHSDAVFRRLVFARAFSQACSIALQMAPNQLDDLRGLRLVGSLRFTQRHLVQRFR